jgi:hypothetical protein
MTTKKETEPSCSGGATQMAGSDGRGSYLERFGGFVPKISGPYGQGLLREPAVLCAKIEGVCLKL